jgi:addiction module RelB/DinJ family antitoxin
MTAKMQINIDSDVKRQFIAICDHLGMSASTAFNVLARAVVRNKGLPTECVKLDELPDELNPEYADIFDTKESLYDAIDELENGEGVHADDDQIEEINKILKGKRKKAS